MKKTFWFRVLLIVHISIVAVYTFLAFRHEGLNLFAVFLSNIQSLTWNGQFTLDFSCYLMLSGLWIMWRNSFSRYSILLGVLAMVLGIVFFAPYILYLLIKEKGTINQVLIGNQT